MKGTAGAPVEALAAFQNKVFFVLNGRLLSLWGDTINPVLQLPPGVKANSINIGERTYLATDRGLFENTGGTLKPVAALNDALGDDRSVFQIAVGPFMSSLKAA